MEGLASGECLIDSESIQSLLTFGVPAAVHDDVISCRFGRCPPRCVSGPSIDVAGKNGLTGEDSLTSCGYRLWPQSWS